MPVDPLPGNIKGDPAFWPIWRTTAYIDKEGSPETNLFPDRGQILRTLYIAHSSIDVAVTDFWGAASVGTLNTKGSLVKYLSRTIPHAYPKRPWMFVQNISNIIPLGLRHFIPNAEDLALVDLRSFQGRDNDDTPTYQVAEMQLQYLMPTFKIKTDDQVKNTDIESLFFGLPDEGDALSRGYKLNSRYITRLIKNASKMLTIPRGILKDGLGRAIMEAIAINEHVAEITYIWHQVPEDALPEQTWIAGANTVNSAVFDGRPAGTLLFAGEPDIKLSPNPITGNLNYDVTYRFHSFCLVDNTVDPSVIRGHNWVRRLSPDRTRLVPMMFSADGLGVAPGTRVFPDFDFRRLFRPDQL